MREGLFVVILGRNGQTEGSPYERLFEVDMLLHSPTKLMFCALYLTSDCKVFGVPDFIGWLR
jgi:hypothetical protein